jgi:hypothetical protein
MRDCNNLPTDIANSNSHEIFKSRVTNNIKTPTSCFYLAFNLHVTVFLQVFEILNCNYFPFDIINLNLFDIVHPKYFIDFSYAKTWPCSLYSQIFCVFFLDCNNLPTDIANSNSHEIFKSRVTNNIKTPTSCFYLAFNNMHLTRIFNKINVDSIDSMEE